MKFINDILNSRINKYIDGDDVFFESFRMLTLNPTLRNIDLVKDIHYKNLNNLPLVNNKSIYYYIMHGKKFYIDFMNSYAKVFFLKNIFKIPLPYHKVLKYIYVKKKIK